MHTMRLAKKIFSYLKHSYDVRELMLLVALCYWLYVVNMKIFSLYVYLREKSEGWCTTQKHLMVGNNQWYKYRHGGNVNTSDGIATRVTNPRILEQWYSRFLHEFGFRIFRECNDNVDQTHGPCGNFHTHSSIITPTTEMNIEQLPLFQTFYMWPSRNRNYTSKMNHYYQR